MKNLKNNVFFQCYQKHPKIFFIHFMMMIIFILVLFTFGAKNSFLSFHREQNFKEFGKSDLYIKNSVISEDFFINIFNLTNDSEFNSNELDYCMGLLNLSLVIENHDLNKKVANISSFRNNLTGNADFDEYQNFTNIFIESKIRNPYYDTDIVISSEFAKENNISLGDTLIFRFGQKNFEGFVCALAKNEGFFYDKNKTWIHHDFLTRELGLISNRIYNVILLKLKNLSLMDKYLNLSHNNYPSYEINSVQMKGSKYSNQIVNLDVIFNSIFFLVGMVSFSVGILFVKKFLFAHLYNVYLLQIIGSRSKAVYIQLIKVFTALMFLSALVGGMLYALVTLFLRSFQLSFYNYFCIFGLIISSSLFLLIYQILKIQKISLHELKLIILKENQETGRSEKKTFFTFRFCGGMIVLWIIFYLFYQKFYAFIWNEVFFIGCILTFISLICVAKLIFGLITLILKKFVRRKSYFSWTFFKMKMNFRIIMTLCIFLFLVVNSISLYYSFNGQKEKTLNRIEFTHIISQLGTSKERVETFLESQSEIESVLKINYNIKPILKNELQTLSLFEVESDQINLFMHNFFQREKSVLNLNECYVSNYLRIKFDLKIGETLTYSVDNEDFSFIIKDFVDHYFYQNTLITLKNDFSKNYNAIFLKANNLEIFQREFHQLFKNDTVLLTNKISFFESQLATIQKVSYIFLFFNCGLIFLVFIYIFFFLNSIFHKRIDEISLLTILGMNKKSLLKNFLKECSFYALTGLSITGVFLQFFLKMESNYLLKMGLYIEKIDFIKFLILNGAGLSFILFSFYGIKTIKFNYFNIKNLNKIK